MSSSRVVSFDLLRILASIGVIAIHSLAPAFTSEGIIPHKEWLIVDFVACLVRWSVPIFVMLSGALILSSPIQRPWQWTQKKLLSLGIPTLIWTLGYAIIYGYTRNTPFHISQLLHDIFFNQPYEHLYFLYILLQLYCVAPILQHIVIQAPQRAVKLSLILFIAASFYWTDSRFLFTIAVPYLSYFVAGWYVWKYANKNHFALAPYLFFGSTVLMTIGTWHWTMVDRITDNVILMNFHTPLVFIQTVSIFLMAQRISISPSLHHMMQKFAQASFGVYVVHPLVMLAFTFLIPQLFPAIHIWQAIIILIATSVMTYKTVLLFQTLQMKWKTLPPFLQSKKKSTIDPHI